MRQASAVIAGLVLAAAAAALPSAAAAPADLTKIRADYRKANKLTRCRFTASELQRALTLVRQNPDEAYGAFAAAIDGELARIGAKFCKGAVAESARKKASIKVRVSKVSSSGGVAKESVTLKNSSSKRAEVKGGRLRNRNGTRVTVPTVSVAAGKTVTVHLACGKAAPRHVYVCAKQPLLVDKGDVVRLLDKQGVVASQRGFGKYAGVFRF